MPNRIIKESICTSESIKNLSWFEEVFFYRLIVNCDDYGRMDARPEILQARLFPLRRDITEQTVRKALNVLATAGMVQVYTYDGKPFLQLTAWERHQQIRAKKSKYPDPKLSDSIGNHVKSDVPVFENPKRESESESNDVVVNARAREEISRVTTFYEQQIGALPSPSAIEMLLAYTEDMGAEVVCKAVEIAVDAGAKNWRYIESVLQNWTKQKVKSLADVQRIETQRQKMKEASNGRNAGSTPATDKPKRSLGGVTEL